MTTATRTQAGFIQAALDLAHAAELVTDSARHYESISTRAPHFLELMREVKAFRRAYPDLYGFRLGLGDPPAWTHDLAADHNA